MRFLSSFAVVCFFSLQLGIYLISSLHWIKPLCKERYSRNTTYSGNQLRFSILTKHSHVIEKPGKSALSSSNMAVCVLSRRSSFQLRGVIRKTWAANTDYVYFVIGSACLVPPQYRQKISGRAEGTTCQVRSENPLPPQYPMDVANWTIRTDNEDEELHHEQFTYQDILFVKDVDYYDTLPAKLKGCYEMVTHFMPNVEWIVKVDDDSYVEPNKLRQEVTHYNSLVPCVIGNIVQGSPAQSGKWKELPQFPSNRPYPKFPLGSYGHIVTRSVANYLTTHERELFDYQGEDTSLGIWLDQSRLNVTFLSGNRFMTNNGRCEDKEKAVVGHNLNSNQIIRCKSLRSFAFNESFGNKS